MVAKNVAYKVTLHSLKHQHDYSNTLTSSNIDKSPGVEFVRTICMFRKRKKNLWLFISVLHEIWNLPCNDGKKIPQKVWWLGCLQFSDSLFGQIIFYASDRGQKKIKHGSSLIRRSWTLQGYNNVSGYRIENYSHDKLVNEIKINDHWQWLHIICLLFFVICSL